MPQLRKSGDAILKVPAVSAAKMPIAEMPRRLKASRLGAICLRRSFGCSRLTRLSRLGKQNSGTMGLRVC